jgi:hypothetical protein
MTTVILTGVTALVRATAYTMETKGVTYPAQDIREFMRAADITHISNEIPFYTGCDFPNPSRTKLVFCSDPKYIELLARCGHGRCRTDRQPLRRLRRGRHAGDARHI